MESIDNNHKGNTKDNKQTNITNLNNPKKFGCDLAMISLLSQSQLTP